MPRSQSVRSTFSIGRPRSSTRRHETPRSWSSPDVIASTAAVTAASTSSVVAVAVGDATLDGEPGDCGQALGDLGSGDRLGLVLVDAESFESRDELCRLSSIAGSEVADPPRFGWWRRFGRRDGSGSGSLDRLRRLRWRRGRRVLHLADAIGQWRFDRTLVACRLDRRRVPPSATGTARARAAARTRWSGSCPR